MRAIYVNPEEKTIDTVECDGTLEGIQKFVFPNGDSDGTCVTIAWLRIRHPITGENTLVDAWVDDEGLLKKNKLTRLDAYPTPLAGNILLLTTNDDGECTEIPEELVEFLKDSVTFTGMELSV